MAGRADRDPRPRCGREDRDRGTERGVGHRPGAAGEGRGLFERCPRDRLVLTAAPRPSGLPAPRHRTQLLRSGKRPAARSGAPAAPCPAAHPPLPGLRSPPRQQRQQHGSGGRCPLAGSRNPDLTGRGSAGGSRGSARVPGFSRGVPGGSAGGSGGSAASHPLADRFRALHRGRAPEVTPPRCDGAAAEARPWHGGGGSGGRACARGRAAGAAGMAAQRLPLRYRPERLPKVGVLRAGRGAGAGPGASGAGLSCRNLLVNLGLFAAGVWVARNLTDIDLMAPQPVP